MACHSSDKNLRFLSEMITFGKSQSAMLSFCSSASIQFLAKFVSLSSIIVNCFENLHVVDMLQLNPFLITGNCNIKFIVIV